jgi:hypothetical protein
MLTLLAQTIFAEPTPLAEPGPLELWLNQRALVSGAIVGVLGVVFLIGPGQGMKRGWLIALGILALAAAIVAFGRLYESPRERVRSGADAFYAAVAAGDADAAEGVLAPEVGIAAAGTALARDGRGFLLAGIERLDRADLRTLALEARQAEVFSEDSARTQTQLRAVFGGGGPNVVWVALDWRRTGEDWRIRGVDILLINGKPPGQALLGAVR